MSVHIPHLRFKPTPFMAQEINRIALREGRTQSSVLQTLIWEALMERLSNERMKELSVSH